MHTYLLFIPIFCSDLLSCFPLVSCRLFIPIPFPAAWSEIFVHTSYLLTTASVFIILSFQFKVSNQNLNWLRTAKLSFNLSKYFAWRNTNQVLKVCFRALKPTVRQGSTPSRSQLINELPWELLPFRTNPTPDTPLRWEKWRVQYKLALLATENIILDIVVGPKPETEELALEPI